MPYQLIDPNEILDYTCDWSPWLDDGGSPSDTIDTSTWSIAPTDGSPAGPSLSSETNTTNTATVFITGAEFGSIYRLQNKIVTASGRTAERTITLQCEHR